MQNSLKRSSIERPGFVLRELLIAVVVTIAILLMAFFVQGSFARQTTNKVDAVLVSKDTWADESRCIECHEQAETFSQTGHAQTLTRATDASSMKLLAMLAESEAGKSDAATLTGEHDSPRLSCETDGISNSASVDWCFGSGAHARTWVSTLSDSYGSTDLLELRWTWFHSTGSFDVTPGQPEKASLLATGQLGFLFDGPRAIRCFACHTSRMEVSKDGGIVESTIHAGVTCQRCHGPRKRHVDSEGEITNDFWKTKDRQEAVDRCAQCHRTPDEKQPTDIRPDNRDIVRFQPIGLSQSACFTQSQMTCTTCHDPHKPLSAQDSKGIQQCIQCHDSQKPDHVTCADGQIDNCVKCHMPQVKAAAPVSFTDHWIRVRSEDQQ